MKQVIRQTLILLATLAVAGTLQAQVEPEKTPDVAAKAYRHADLTIPAFNDELGQLPPQAAAQARERLARLGVNQATARVDRRSGRFVTLMPTEPMVPGKGVGNHLRWADLKVAAPQNRAVREKAAGDAFLGYLDANQADLGVDPSELSDLRIASHADGDLYQIYARRTLDGIPVRDSHVSAVIGQGNLTLLSAHQWGDRTANPNRPQISADEARFEAEGYLASLGVTREWGKPEQLYVPMARANGNAPYRYQLVWSVKLNVEGDGGNWEVLVDAHDGGVLSNQDTNQYAEIKGGVYPVTNDGIVPDGVEQAGWPMPFQDTTIGTTDTGGNVPGFGSITATFYGPYVDINDNCGAASLTQSDGIDWGTSGGTDCTTPGFGGAGNTHASRTCFYELNKIKEMARGQLPSNTWLQNRLTANVNINNTCNAFWNGSTVNFYRSGGCCANTGEIAGVFDHEWGHGMDANDVVGGIASPSGEGIADIYAALRLDTSCIGRNFCSTVCSGNGDPCLTCTGVRDIDYLKRASGNPHDYSWSNANCGGSVHCVGGVYSEAVWSLWKRKLPTLYGMDNNTAHEITTRLTYIAAGVTSIWFSGGPPNGGCSGSSGYNNYLAADDDNGNINDGTPHMVAIYQSFNDQEIACQTPTPTDSGCSGVPTSAPSVTAIAGNNSVSLSWGSVSGASRYDVFRTEGVFQCDFGKVRLGETTGTTWNDGNHLQNGREYCYIVIPMGSNDACFGPASACACATPLCVADADCDDGLWCNGSETCNAGSCVAGSDPCPGQGCDEVNDVCSCQNGPQDAVYDSGLGAPKCAVAGSECDSLALLDGRGTVGPEPNQPNTIDSCTDGTSGTYHSDESNDKIVVKTLDGSDMVEGATVQVDATVYAWSTGTSDHLDLWYAADANAPFWQLITTVNLSSGGLQTLSAQYTLPSGSLQAVRANFRYNGGPSTCPTGSYDDTDDLVFAVNSGECPCGRPQPVVTISAPPDGSIYNECETVTFTGTASDAEASDLTSALTWTSSLDGTIGSGGSFSTSTLSAGTHTITASVTDSCGLLGSDSIQVTILAAVCPGIDLLETPVDGGQIVIDIPGGFFDADPDCTGGSKPVPTTDPQNPVSLQGKPLKTSPAGVLGTTDTVMERLQDAVFVNGVANTPVIIRALSLVSVTPLTVDCGDGSSVEYDVVVSLDGQQTAGTMTIYSAPPAEDPVYDATFPVTGHITSFYPGTDDCYSSSGPGGPCSNLLDLDAPQTITTDGAPWTSTPGPGVDCDGLMVDSDGDGEPDYTIQSQNCGGGNFGPAGLAMYDDHSPHEKTEPAVLPSCQGCGCQSCTVVDDFESGTAGWLNDPASTCTAGAYVTGDPTNPGGGYQVAGSHSGTTSIFTAVNTSAGVDDVDGGVCILASPSWPVSCASTLRVWYWHGQRDAGDDASGDFFRLEYSTNDGASWTTLASNGDSTSNPAWAEATASIPAGSTVQLRMQCSDGAGPGDIVECGIDDFSICN